MLVFALGGGFGVEERLVDMSLAKFKASSSPRVGDEERSLSLSSSSSSAGIKKGFFSSFSLVLMGGFGFYMSMNIKQYCDC